MTGFFIDHDDDQLRATWAQVAELDIDADAARLGCAAAELEPASLRGDELALVDSVLDNQVLDMRRRRFVRVQDVVLTPRGGDLVVAGVDASQRRPGAALRPGLPLAPPAAPQRRLRALGRRQPHRPAPLAPQLRGGLRRAQRSCTRPTSPTISARWARASARPCWPRSNTGLAADTLQEMDEELADGGAAGDAARRAPPRCWRRSRPTRPPTCSASCRTTWRRSCSRGCPAEREEDLRELASHPEHTAGSLMTTDFVTAAAGGARPAAPWSGSAASGPESTP